MVNESNCHTLIWVSLKLPYLGALPELKYNLWDIAQIIPCIKILKRSTRQAPFQRTLSHFYIEHRYGEFRMLENLQGAQGRRCPLANINLPKMQFNFFWLREKKSRQKYVEFRISKDLSMIELSKFAILLHPFCLFFITNAILGAVLFSSSLLLYWCPWRHFYESPWEGKVAKRWKSVEGMYVRPY